MKPVITLLLCLALIFGATGCGKGPSSVIQYSLTLSVMGEGTVTPASGAKYNSGTLVELIPTAATGWAFSAWGGPDGASVVTKDGIHKIVMDKSKKVEAIFVKLMHEVAISVTPPNGGSVDASVVADDNLAANASFEHGQTIQLNAIPSPGYAFDHWEGELSGTGNPTTLLVDGPKSITAVFVPIIEGQVIGRDSLAGLPNITLMYSGAKSGVVVTDRDGRYRISGVSGAVTITPSIPPGVLSFQSDPPSINTIAPRSAVNFIMSMVVNTASWGTYGGAAGEFNTPWGLALDNTGHVYVADSNNYRIQKFSNTGVFLSQWGSFGNGPGQFDFPHDVAVDSTGYIYVLDLRNNRIQKFDSAGNLITLWGGVGSGVEQFNNPASIAIDRLDNIYVADTSNHRIQKFNSSGVFLSQWGSYGTGFGQFNFPRGIAVDRFGNVYVADTNNNRVQKFSNTGVYLGQWGSYGSGNGMLINPHGITTDQYGNVYVIDTGNSRIQKFNSAGVYLDQWGSYGTFAVPADVTLGSSGTMFVLDASQCRIFRLQLVH